MAASAASLMAVYLVLKWSYTSRLAMLSTFPVMIWIPWGLVLFATISFEMMSFELRPAFSARILGMISKDLANLLYEYWSRPVTCLASSSNLIERIWIMKKLQSLLLRLLERILLLWSSTCIDWLHHPKLFRCPPISFWCFLLKWWSWVCTPQFISWKQPSFTIRVLRLILHWLLRLAQRWVGRV